MELDLYDDMTVLTGETGAGKSIIIDTLDIVLGGRSDASLIRYGKDFAEITVSFDVSKAVGINSWLQQNEFTSDDECVIRRVIKQDGRSKIFINGSIATQQVVRELGNMLVNVHGQHESQYLLKAEKHLALLDDFAGNSDLCHQVKQVHSSWLSAKKDLAALLALSENHQEKIDFINYQLKELEELALQKDEVEALHKEHSYLSNAEQLISNCNLALELTADKEECCVLDLLSSARDNISAVKVDDVKIKSIVELLTNAIVNTEEAVLELRSYASAIEINQDNLVVVEKRLNNIYDVARKHKVKPEELFAIHQKLKQQSEDLLALEKNMQKARDKIIALENEYQNIALSLSSNRKKAATKLNKLVTEKMQLLGMEGGKFSINIESCEQNVIRANGLDSVEFLVSANPGMPLQPLRKVASGGELSRISLAIQVITMNKGAMPVLIFDEVDVGIGGKTAEIVGKLLKNLAAKTQVLCVTHLPQVAIQGKQHLTVEKITDGKTTEAKITNLNKKARIEEIARMLGGINISAKTLATAKEMLESVSGQLH